MSAAVPVAARDAWVAATGILDDEVETDEGVVMMLLSSLVVPEGDQDRT